MSNRTSYAELCNRKRDYLQRYQPYCMVHYTQFHYDILTKNIISRRKAGRGDNTSYNDIIIMADTETSKCKENTYYYEAKAITDKNGDVRIQQIKKYNPVENYVVAWTISMRAFGLNLATLYGNSPEEFCDCLEKLQEALPGDDTFIYWHNMSYDWPFIRKFMFAKFGHPDKQLNTKSYYPIYIKWSDAHIIFRDSLILSQRRLEKWADDLNVTHKKAVGKWNYDKIRQQMGYFSRNELDYIECDTLAGVECIDATMEALNKKIYSMPYTATGIPREEMRKIGKKHGARNTFLSMVLSYEQYIIATRLYHGGYTHANRFLIDKLIFNVLCRDFSSSYPYVMLTEKYPMEKFMEYEDCDPKEILDQADDYAFMFKLIMVYPRLKDYHNPMPALQFSKCASDGGKVINPVLDNGRILAADYVEIWLNEVDLSIIYNQYNANWMKCTHVEVAAKDYLPRWFTDYVYKLYEDKCKLKEGDPVLYSIAKAKLNSLYGMCVQKSIRDNIEENYVTGEYKVTDTIDMKTGEKLTPEQQYEKFVENNNSVLPYQWGVWVTSYAMRNLFDLAECTKNENQEMGFVYSDTDSIYSTYWDEDALNSYNLQVLRKLEENNYKPVEYNGEIFTPGKAEFDGFYSEYKVLGAKRYCCRYAIDARNKVKNFNKLKITVAGVPKCGVDCLDNDINNFTSGFIFPGTKTGKLTHHYICNPEIRNIDGNLYGDSVDLTSCDYLLSSIDVIDFDVLDYEEIEVQQYD